MWFSCSMCFVSTSGVRRYQSSGTWNIRNSTYERRATTPTSDTRGLPARQQGSAASKLSTTFPRRRFNSNKYTHARASDAHDKTDNCQEGFVFHRAQKDASKPTTTTIIVKQIFRKLSEDKYDREMSITVSDSSRQTRYILSFISSAFFVCLFFLIALRFFRQKRHISDDVPHSNTNSPISALFVFAVRERLFLFFVSISCFGFFEIRA